MARIQLNGKKVNISQKTTLFDLVKKYKLDKKKVAVELNGKIINKNIFKKKILKNNDVVEIVHFIGGG